MWNEISRWWTRNHLEITWFIIGWCAFATLAALFRGDWVQAAIAVFFTWSTYKLRKVI
jgi:hypothetical protein